MGDLPTNEPSWPLASRGVALAALLLPALAVAGDLPQFSTGGFLFSVQYGAGFFLLDQPRLASQVGEENASVYAADAKNTHTIALRASYNIKGHASVAADFTATGWSLSDPNRGGAGFLVGAVAWHPLELVWMKKEKRPVPLDVSTWFGVGYGIGGQRRGMDGLVLEWGLDASYFFTRYFGVGVFLRDVFLAWGSFYIDYYGRSQAGATIALPRGSGGAFLHVGVSLHFRAGE